MCTQEESEDIRNIAMATIPGIKILALPQGLQVIKGPGAVMEYVKLAIPKRFRNDMKTGRDQVILVYIGSQSLKRAFISSTEAFCRLTPSGKSSGRSNTILYMFPALKE